MRKPLAEEDCELQFFCENIYNLFVCEDEEVFVCKDEEIFSCVKTTFSGRLYGSES